MKKFNGLNRNISSVQCISFFVVALGLFVIPLFGNRALAGGPAGGLLPSDPLSIAAGSLIPGFDDLYCTVNPGETWVAGALGYNICGSSGGGKQPIYSPTGNGSLGGGKCDCSDSSSVCRGHPYKSKCGASCLGSYWPGCGDTSQHCGGYKTVCGKTCSGTMAPSCPNQANICNNIQYPSSNGCGTCTGTKAPTYTKTCVYSDTGNVCGQNNCSQTIKIKSAYCANVPNNGCGSQHTLPINQCASFVSCQDQYANCPPCSWKEVAP